jgi:hypothetical protein
MYLQDFGASAPSQFFVIHRRNAVLLSRSAFAKTYSMRGEFCD